jgi:Raf kinase inhibitor-like YbhB/YbcL family protein
MKSILILSLLFSLPLLPQSLWAGSTAKTPFVLSSGAFREGERMPKTHTADGEDRSPPLTWSGVPDKAKELMLICDDPDAPQSTPWVHWVAYGIGPGVTALLEGIPPLGAVTLGKLTFRQGKTSWGSLGYRGPSPPPGKPHRYFFKLYALDAPVNLPPEATKDVLLSAARGHILTETHIMARYGRE